MYRKVNDALMIVRKEVTTYLQVWLIRERMPSNHMPQIFPLIYQHI